jgi:prepilin-type N-terminal cleavage/methylation domain-containing protein
MKKKKRGFTLLEMVIVLVLAVLVIAIVNFIFLTGSRVFTDTNVKSDLHIEGQNIQQEISNSLMGAVEIEEIQKADGEIIDFKKSEDDVKKNSIMNTKVEIGYVIITVVEENESGVVEKNNYKFKVDGNTLYCEKIGIHSEKVLTTNVGKEESTNKPEFYIKVHDNSAEFYINLHKEKGQTDKNYPIKVDVLFRNKDFTS